MESKEKLLRRACQINLKNPGRNFKAIKFLGEIDCVGRSKIQSY
jgi:hypothetical protein